MSLCPRCTQVVDPNATGLRAPVVEKDGTVWHEGCAADVAHEHHRDRSH